MAKSLTTIFMTALLIIAPLSSAFANPIPSTKGTAFVGIFFMLALLIEVVVTMMMLRRYRLRTIRLGIVYLGVNLVSFLLFIIGILPVFRGLGLFFPIPETLAEAFVILLETTTLFMMINLEWFRSENSQEVSIQSTLVAVTVGNVTSILCGCLVLLPSSFALMKFIRH